MKGPQLYLYTSHRPGGSFRGALGAFVLKPVAGDKSRAADMARMEMTSDDFIRAR